MVTFWLPFALITVLSMRCICETAQVCDDLVPGVCQDMYKLDPDLCSDPCKSIVLCRRFCGHCSRRKCYECHEVDHPSQCNTTAYCPSEDYLCITSQTFTDDFREVYKLGCAPKDICSAHFGPIVGRRQENSLAKRGQIQGQCCNKDYCNHGDTSNVTVATVAPKPTSVATMNTTSAAVISTTNTSAPICADVDPDICARMASSIHNMCDVGCIATSVCPVHCGNCVRCYDCSHVASTEACDQFTGCYPGQKCFSVETITSAFEHGYRLGCMEESLCSSFENAAPSVFGKRQDFELTLHGGCCSGDLCNHHMLLPTTLPTSTTTRSIASTTHKHVHVTCRDTSGQLCRLISCTHSHTNLKYLVSHCALTCHLCDQYISMVLAGEISAT